MKIALISVDETIAMLGVRDISAVLKKEGYDVEVLSMQGKKGETKFNNIQLSLLEKFINGCDVVGVSSVVINKQKAIQVLSLAKKLGMMTIWGGVHPTLFPVECCNYCDYVCIGEGENTWLEFVKSLENNKTVEDIHNLVFKDKLTNKIKINSLYAPIVNLDDQPFPDHDIQNQYILVDNSMSNIYEYLQLNKKHQGRDSYIYMYSSKGCPYSCTYCSNSKLNEIYEKSKTRVRYKSAERIISELIELKEIYKDFKKVWIMDDSFLTRNIDDLIKFKNLYVKDINLPLDFFTAPNMISEEKMKALLPIDISLIRIGVQSGSNNTLKKIYNRYIDSKHVIKASEVLNNINKTYHSNINAVYQIIINNPYETNEDLTKTINVIREIKPPFFLSTFFLIYFPGSKLYDKAMSDGIITKDNSDEEFLAENVEHHLKIDSKNLYLNSVLFWMHGEHNSSHTGIISRHLLRFLISKPIVYTFSKFPKTILKINKKVSLKQKNLIEFLDGFNKENSNNNNSMNYKCN